jgi:hypothetical protein
MLAPALIQQHRGCFGAAIEAEPHPQQELAVSSVGFFGLTAPE